MNEVVFVASSKSVMAGFEIKQISLAMFWWVILKRMNHEIKTKSYTAAWITQSNHSACSAIDQW